MKPAISKERWGMLAALFLASVVLIAGKSVYLDTVPVWVYIVQASLIVTAIVFAVLETRHEKTVSETKERISL
jgi:hypothetical protein